MPLEKYHKSAACMTVFQVFLLAPIVKVRAIQRCDVPPAYEKQISFVSCHFDYDIGAIKKPITVLYYGTGHPVTPVILVHSALFEGKLEYFTHPGFTIIGNVTNTLRLRIDSVTQDHVGRYECHYLPSISGNYASCNFILKVGDAPGTSTSLDKQVAPYSPGISNDEDTYNNDEDTYMKPLIITTVSVALLVIAVGGILTVTALYKRLMKKSDGRENGSDESMLENNGS